MGCNGNCDTCGGCGNGSCGGCGNSLEITELELNLLQTLWQYAFLPVLRKADDPVFVYPDAEPSRLYEYSLALQCLEKKGLIDIDFSKPLQNYTHPMMERYPICGSIGLTLNSNLFMTPSKSVTAVIGVREG